MKHIKSFFVLLASWSMYATATWAQTPFFTHTVEAGETVYSISKIYHVTTEDIYKLNPETRNGLRSGTTLKIPQNKADQKFSRFHTIAKGETLFQLTQLYHVSAEDICLANPGLTASNFKAGEVIVIPPSNGKEAEVQKATDDKGTLSVLNSGCKEMHRVKRKETIFSISQKYGLTTEQLIEANPEMKDPDYKLKKGSLVCIPYPEKKTVKKTPSNQELFPQKSGPEKMQQITMGVLLPLTQQNSEGEKMIEFYQGLLLAVEDLKNMGTSVTVYTYDCGKSIADMKAVLTRPGLSKADVIFGPLSSAQIPTLGNFCRENKIKMVVPFSSQCDEVYKNPYLYVSNVPKSTLFEETYKLLQDQFSNRHFVIWNSGEQREDDLTFINGLKRMLNAHAIPFREVSAGSSSLQDYLSLGRKNIIVPNSASLKALNKLCSELNLFKVTNPEYQFSLLGHPEWQIYTNSQLENFFRFDTYIYSSFYKNMNKVACGPFENRFEKDFHTELQNTFPSFGMLGYDLGRFFLMGLANKGNDFDSNISTWRTDPLQNDFYFKRASNWSGFINNKAELIHYTPQKKIDVIEFTKK